MTRDQIVQAAARRLGDSSSNFVTTILDPLFDDVLRDLAQAEALSLLRKSGTFAVVTDQRDYVLSTVLGLAYTPMAVRHLVVYAWGPDAAPVRFSDLDFQARRLAQGEAFRGRWESWRLYPGPGTLQVQPPADSSAAAGATAEILYLAPPTVIAGGTDITEVHVEDIETVVFGLHARGASFKDETQNDFVMAAEMYERGKAAMLARRNQEPLGCTGRPY